MLKKVTMLAVAAAALAALAIPASASAAWQHGAVALEKDETIQLTGDASFTGSEIGSVQCQVKAHGHLRVGAPGNLGEITSFGVDLTQEGSTVTSKCKVDEVLEFLGCSDVASVTSTGFPWGVEALSGQTLKVSTGTIQNHLHGGIFCPKTIQLTPGTVHITTTTSSNWTEGQLSGTLQGDGGVQQNVTISGQGTVSPSGTFGFK